MIKRHHFKLDYMHAIMYITTELNLKYLAAVYFIRHGRQLYSKNVLGYSSFAFFEFKE